MQQQLFNCIQAMPLLLLQWPKSFCFCWSPSCNMILTFCNLTFFFAFRLFSPHSAIFYCNFLSSFFCCSTHIALQRLSCCCSNNFQLICIRFKQQTVSSMAVYCNCVTRWCCVCYKREDVVVFVAWVHPVGN